MKSMRELREELTGVRLAAGDSSIWHIAVSVHERAHLAIQDAARMYEFFIPNTYYSINPAARVQAVPKNIRRITNLVGYASDGATQVPIPDYQLQCTPFTHVLTMHLVRQPMSIQLDYEERVQDPPPDVFVVGSVSDTAVGLNTTSTIVSSYWTAPGFIELSVDNTIGREIVAYQSVTPTGFTGLTRAVMGPAVNWPDGTRVSCVLPVQPEATIVLMRAAEANMYNYWVANRAMYDRFTAMANVAALEVEDILAMVRLNEQRAAEAYQRTRKPPLPGKARIK